MSEEFFPEGAARGAGEVEIPFRHCNTGAVLWMIYNVFQVRDGEGRVSGYATVNRWFWDIGRSRLLRPLKSNDQCGA